VKAHAEGTLLRYLGPREGVSADDPASGGRSPRGGKISGHDS
jgi:hypothetical protein